MPAPADATSLPPPMLDITRQCDLVSRHNATAMSECVVAESEARAELLQRWQKMSDASAEKCVKFGRKAKRQPYGAMLKCLSVEKVDVPAVAPPAPAPTKPADAGITTKWPFFSFTH